MIYEFQLLSLILMFLLLIVYYKDSFIKGDKAENLVDLLCKGKNIEDCNDSEYIKSIICEIKYGCRVRRPYFLSANEALRWPGYGQFTNRLCHFWKCNCQLLKFPSRIGCFLMSFMLQSVQKKEKERSFRYEIA